MILYIENFKESTTKLLKLIREFSKIARYMFNIQKSAVFLYGSDEQTKNEIKKQFHLQWHQKEQNTGVPVWFSH